MPFIMPDWLKRITGAFLYVFASYWFIHSFFVGRILHSDWGDAHVMAPALFAIWYPGAAALFGLMGWLDRRVGLIGFGIVLATRIVENLLTSELFDYHWDYVMLALFAPMAFAAPLAWICRIVFHLDSYEIEETQEA